MAVLAQLVEHWIVIPRVTGSSPVHRPKKYQGLQRTSLQALFISGTLLAHWLPRSEQALSGVSDLAHRAAQNERDLELLGSRLLGVLGVLQCEGEVVHLNAKRLVDHTELLGSLHTNSRDFR